MALVSSLIPLHPFWLYFLSFSGLFCACFSIVYFSIWELLFTGILVYFVAFCSKCLECFRLCIYICDCN